MNQLLGPGQQVVLDASAAPIQVEAFVAAGARAEIYRVACGDGPAALKWYVPACAEADTGLLDRLRQLAAAGAPCDEFLWPTDLATALNVGAFGYVMPMLHPAYVSLASMPVSQPRPKTAMATGSSASAASLSASRSRRCFRY